ncbi:MAG TPA: hypothetical protein VMS96_08275 [Terriglobales bacterium]|nr:hypothetical protein [Terriglobales bacterium]
MLVLLRHRHRAIPSPSTPPAINAIAPGSGTAASGDPGSVHGTAATNRCDDLL